MLIFVFICKEMREWGAIWAAVGGFFRIFPGSFSGGRGFLEGFWGREDGWRGDLGPGSGGIGRCAPGRAEARPQNQDGS